MCFSCAGCVIWCFHYRISKGWKPNTKELLPFLHSSVQHLHSRPSSRKKVEMLHSSRIRSFTHKTNIFKILLRWKIRRIQNTESATYCIQFLLYFKLFKMLLRWKIRRTWRHKWHVVRSVYRRKGRRWKRKTKLRRS